MENIVLSIDGESISSPPGSTILEVAERHGIKIPTLCHHDALEPAGACRLCMVEITHPDWGGWKGLVTSCLYPVEEGLRVATYNEEIREVRRTMLDLLLSRCPGSDFMRKLAAEHGVTAPTWRQREEETTCILCTLCVRVCAVKGCNAIGTGNRGIERIIARPFDQPPPDCIGCASCAHICSSLLPQMPISDIMRYLMYYNSYGRRDTARQLFAQIPGDVRNGLLDIDYSAAEARCPQHLPIGRLVAEAISKLAPAAPTFV